MDEVTNKPVEAAAISFQAGVTTSDELGYFAIDKNESGPVVITHISYESLTINTKAIRKNGIITLTPKSVILPEVVVNGYDHLQKLTENAGAISYVTKRDISRLDHSSLLVGINTVPGVRMEERSPGSYRISIRGSQLRSPFGVRNVKIYWNDIPLTDPTGNTPLNLLSVSNIGSLEVIRGPAGSVFGAGMGGVIVMSSHRAGISQRQVESDFNIGSFNSLLWATRYRADSENSNIFADVTFQKTAGYRDQSAFDRKTFEFFSTLRNSTTSRLSVSLFYSDLYYNIPGGLTQSQFDQEPTQARPGSASQNASIDSQSARLGLSYTKDWGNVNNTSSLFLFTTRFENPFITDYKKELQSGFGGRTRFGISGNLGSVPYFITAGGEGQLYAAAARNFGNVNGSADTLRFSDDIRNLQYFLFAQGELMLSSRSRLVIGLSYNWLDYDIDRTVDNISGIPSKFSRRLDPVLAPRIGWVQKLSDRVASHVSISYGFSPPTILEVRTNEGSINEDLQAENGTNYELGVRAGWKKFQFDISTFYFNLENVITSEASSSGVILFENAGSTNQYGIELKVDYILIREPSSLLRESRVGVNYTLHYFKFNEYEKLGDDFSGNWFTGTPRNLVFATWDLEFRHGIYLDIIYNYTDKIPLDDGNTVWSDPFHLLNFRGGLKFDMNRTWNLDLYGGVDNTLDYKYSRGNDLNAFGGRYFQPAPTINYFAGLKVAYNL